MRSIPTRPSIDNTAKLLQQALYLEKSLGHADSAITVYRALIESSNRGLADRQLALRAQDRLRHLGVEIALRDPAIGSESSTGTTRSTGLDRVLAHVSVADTRLRSLPAKGVPQRGRATRSWAGSGTPDGWRWQLRPTQTEDPPSPSPVVAALAAGAGALRRFLGLKGLNHYIEQELRRHRPRGRSPHELLLSALLAEKEQTNCSTALRQYRELVQLDLPGGIATHLTERAQRGIVRCQSRQSARAAGS